MLKNVIDNLNSVDRKTLEYAASHNIAQFVKLGGGKYVGVYAERVPNLQAQSTAGNWSYGNIKESK